MSTTIDGAAATRPPWDAEAQAVADCDRQPAVLYDLGPEKGREVVHETQAGEISLCRIAETSSSNNARSEPT